MREFELIKKIQELKMIKPRKDWVVLTKKELFQEGTPSSGEQFSGISGILEAFPWLFRHYKPVLAAFVFLGILIVSGSFIFAQNALPGDSLYVLKRTYEKGVGVLSSSSEQPRIQLELANKRLEELKKIAETDQVQRLSPAINEFQVSASAAAKKLKEPNKLTKEIVKEAQKLEENKEKIESLGILLGETKELDNALSQLVEREIRDLEARTLPEEKTEILSQAEEDYENGNFSSALEKILIISNQ